MAINVFKCAPASNAELRFDCSTAPPLRPNSCYRLSASKLVDCQGIGWFECAPDPSEGKSRRAPASGTKTDD